MNDSNKENECSQYYKDKPSILLKETEIINNQLICYEQRLREITVELNGYKQKSDSYNKMFDKYCAQVEVDQIADIFKRIRISQVSAYLKAYIIMYNDKVNSNLTVLLNRANETMADFVSDYEMNANSTDDREKYIGKSKIAILQIQKQIQEIKDILASIEQIQITIERLIAYAINPKEAFTEDIFEGLSAHKEVTYKQILQNLENMCQDFHKEYQDYLNVQGDVNISHSAQITQTLQALNDMVRNFKDERQLHSIFNVLSTSPSFGSADLMIAESCLNKAKEFFTAALLMKAGIQNHISIITNINPTQGSVSTDNDDYYINSVIESFTPLVKNTLDVAEAYMQVHNSCHTSLTDLINYALASKQFTDTKKVEKLCSARDNLLKSKNRISNAFVNAIQKEEVNISMHAGMQMEYSILDAKNIVNTVYKILNNQYEKVQQYVTYAKKTYEKVNDENQENESLARLTLKLYEMTKTYKSIFNTSLGIVSEVNTSISNIISNSVTSANLNQHQESLKCLISRHENFLCNLNTAINLLPKQCNYSITQTRELLINYQLLASHIQKLKKIVEDEIFPFMCEEDLLNNSEKLVQIIICLGNFTQIIEEFGNACEACVNQICRSMN
ncbi:hypothetical protein [Candidatus Cardinium hertigii]|nr:hypothetical protein [Candidatus Cardinium hertigii]